MNKKIVHFLQLILYLSIIIFSKGIIVNAENDGIGFEVSPILSSTQIDRELGYYYIQTEPNVKQSFDMSVLNTSDKGITLEVFIENAISTDNGSISYSDNLEKIDKSLKNPLSEIIVPKEKSIIVKAREEKTVSFEITPPKSSYSGIKMGRVIIKERIEKNKKGIKQQYQYGVGIITSESGDSFNDGQTLDLTSVKASIYSGSKVMEANIVNPDPKTIENLKVRSYVTKKGDSKKIKERNIDNFSFAPNSKLSYMIPWGLSNFKTGEYTFHFTASNEFDSFDLKKDFKIRGDDANKLNNEVAFSVGTSKMIIITIIIVNSILVCLIFFILIRNKKWIQKLKTKKQKRGKKKIKRG